MFESALSVVGGVLAVAVLLGAAYAAFRTANLRATVGDQARLIEALKASRDETQRELAQEQQERALLAERLALTEEKVRHLEEIVSGRIDFSALETSLEHLHMELVRRIDEQHRETMSALKDIKALLEAKRAGDL